MTTIRRLGDTADLFDLRRIAPLGPHHCHIRAQGDHRVSERAAVHAARHVDVGEQRVDIGPAFELGERLLRVGGLDDVVASILEDADGAHAHERFVLDDEYGGAGGGHDGISLVTMDNGPRPGMFRISAKRLSIYNGLTC